MFLLTNDRCYYRTYGNKEACESKFAGFWCYNKTVADEEELGTMQGAAFFFG